MIGLPALLANMARIGAQIEGPATAEGLMDAAKSIRDAWIDGIVSEGLVQTGRYRDSITIKEHGPDLVSISSDVPYAPFLEFGTSHVEPHHVAERASDENHDEVVERLGHRISGVMR